MSSCENEEEEEKEITKLDNDIQDWIKVRQDTIQKLREISDYIDSIAKKSSIAKAIGSSSGAVAGGLGIVGGALTIASAGLAAIPILFISGTAFGLTAAVTGASATVAERVMKSKQMKNAKEALEIDSIATSHLQEHMAVFAQKDNLVKKVTKDILSSSYGVTSNTYKIALAIINPKTTQSLLLRGVEASAKIFGDDASREVSKLLLVTSGRVISGTLSVVIGGATMVYDIYKLTKEVDKLAKSGSSASTDLRLIADKLEEALLALFNDDKDPDDNNPNDNELQ